MVTILGTSRGALSKYAQRSGITPSKLNRYLTGSIPAADVAIRMARAAGVNVEWLVTGNGPKDPEVSQLQIVVGMQKEEAGADTLAIPCPAVANAGEPIIPEEYLDPDSEKYYLFRTRFLQKLNAQADWICILIDDREGNSMTPTLAPGDLLLVDRNITRYTQSVEALMQLNGKLVLLSDPDDAGLFVKRMWIEEEGRLLASSDNLEFPARLFDLKDCNIKDIIAGRVVWRGHEL